jgi:hypothetical protein
VNIGGSSVKLQHVPSSSSSYKHITPKDAGNKNKNKQQGGSVPTGNNDATKIRLKRQNYHK